MVSIDDYNSNRLSPQPPERRDRQTVHSTPAGDRNKSEETNVARVLAKAAIAVKMQIIAGMGGKTAPQPVRHSSCSKGFCGSGVRQEFNETDRARNLKEIVMDDARWEAFALGALGLQPNTESCNNLRNSLIKGFHEDTWEGFANFISIYSESAGSDENPDSSTPSDNLSTGLIERTELWLTYPTYFETLSSAVRTKSLSQEMNLYTSELLIKYLGTIGQ